MDCHNEFPGMPDFLGEAIGWFLGAVLTVLIFGTPLYFLYKASQTRRWLRIIFYVIVFVIIVFTIVLSWAIIDTLRGQPW